MLVPDRLRDHLSDESETSGHNTYVSGKLACCGQKKFLVRSFGGVSRTLFGQVKLYDADEGVQLTAKCPVCQSEHIVFDSDTDGYDRTVSGAAQLPHARATRELRCSRCGKDAFLLELTLEYADSEEEAEEALSRNGNAFSWIWCKAVCSGCGKELKNLIDFETA